MDPAYAGALKAFLSHQPQEAMPMDGGPDPLKARAPSAAPEVRRRQNPAPSDAHAAQLLPLILAQLPLEPTYRLTPRAPGGPLRT